MKRFCLYALLIFTLASAALAIQAFWIGPRSLVVTRVDIASTAWPPSAPPLKIVLIADPQPAGPHETPSRLRRVVQVANRERPDLILLLGDYVSTRLLKTSFVPPEATTEVFGGLEAPLGIYAVLGNHDWWFDAPRVRRAFEAVGIEVLDNAARRLEHGVHALWLAGVGDITVGKDDLAGTLAAIPDDAPIIVMTHSPDLFPEVPGRVALTVAGHTHGGQVALPYLGRPIVPSRFGERYAYGHVVEDGRHLFVTSGIGHAILPVRFGVPPEIAVITLRAG
ncbi:MAG: metallophosphoesterase [Geminicoccaceae bacterium]